jgi:16S rRNA (guanine966-N2)-methyltransferase
MRAVSSRPPKRSSVRIIAGRWKGRLLEVPEGARPTSGRAREALWSILQKRIPGARVLDLYAGSGAIGFEAVSRGAARAVLVEKNAGALRRNLARLPDAEAMVSVVADDAAAAAADLAGRGVRFDLVFADPPYGSPIADLSRNVAHLLASNAIFVLQSDSFDSGSEPEGLRLLERRPYGRNVFSFFASAPGVRVSGRDRTF